MKLIWSSHALRQLDGIGQFMAMDNTAAATKLLKIIKKLAKNLQAHPYLGRRTEFGDIRELIVHPNYILSYRVSAEAVEIAQIWHAAQKRYH